eukprot:1803464-Amphidinium_carterae.1
MPPLKFSQCAGAGSQCQAPGRSPDDQDANSLSGVEPPYATFYKDGSCWVPKLDKLNGYEDMMGSVLKGHFDLLILLSDVCVLARAARRSNQNCVSPRG